MRASEETFSGFMRAVRDQVPYFTVSPEGGHEQGVELPLERGAQVVLAGQVHLDVGSRIPIRAFESRREFLAAMAKWWDHDRENDVQIRVREHRSRL